MKDILEGLDIPTEVQQTLTERIEAAKESWIEGTKNNPEFIKKLKSEAEGKFFGSMERVYGRNFAELDMDKYSELHGMKKMEAILKDGVSSLADLKDKTNQELQQQYLDAKAELKKVREEELPSLLEAERVAFYKDFENEKLFKDSVNFETTCAKDAHVPLIRAYFAKQGYQSKWNPEVKDYDILTREGVKVTKNDKVLSKEEIIKDAFIFNDVLRKSNGTPPDPKNPGDPIKRPSGKLSDNAQRMLDSMVEK